MKKKMNNKGFSLVELIIVIAIMAVLMVVLAPQLLKYVEKTRLQKDNSAISEIANAIKVACADETIILDVSNAGGRSYSTAATAGAKTLSFNSSSTDKLEVELADVIGASVTTSSTTYSKSTTAITISVSVDGEVTVTGFISEPNSATTETKNF